jgi:hypothetical protein
MSNAVIVRYGQQIFFAQETSIDFKKKVTATGRMSDTGKHNAWGGGTILKFFKPVSFNTHRYTSTSALHQIHIHSFYFLFLKDLDVHLIHRYMVLNKTYKHNIIPLI